MSDVQRVVVLGAGTMGHGIAQVCAMAGFETHMTDITAEAASAGAERVRSNLKKGSARGKVSEELLAETMSRLTTSADAPGAAKNADLIIEAAPEMMEIKKRIAHDIVSCAPAHCIFASNTSSLSVTEIAAAAPHPAQVVGMHFFNPVHIMKLLEVVRAEQTSDETLAIVSDVGVRLGKELIVVSDSAGFATSRLGLIIGLEAMRMLESGVASAEEIDKAMELGYRHPMGPLRLTDLVGLDVRLAIAEHLFAEVGPQFRPPQILRRMVRAGKLGKKTGQGFYSW